MSHSCLAGSLSDRQAPVTGGVSAMCLCVHRSKKAGISAGCFRFDGSDSSRGLVLDRHLLAHLGFQDIVTQADGGADDGSLAAHAESLQLTSPRSAPGTSPPQHMPEANGNTLKEEGMPCLPSWHHRVNS